MQPDGPLLLTNGVEKGVAVVIGWAREGAQLIWTVEWPHGEFDIHSRGGMLAGVKLNVGGRVVSPFYEAPWIAPGRRTTPPILENLRNEFPCVPFGDDYLQDSVTNEWRPSLARSAADAALDESDFMLHGFGAAGEWKLIRKDDLSIEIAIDYPATSPIRRMARKVMADKDGPGLGFQLCIEVRKPVSRPIGVHPNFALPDFSGTFRIRPGAFRFGMVHASGPEPGVSRAEPGATFEDIRSVPMIGGSNAPFDRLPFAYNTEETLQLCGIDGRVGLDDENLGVSYELEWNPEDFNSLLIWISNRGRSYDPWDSRNLCVGVEPFTGTFDLGTRASLSSNPINRRGVATVVDFDPSNPRTIEYRFSVQPTAEVRYYAGSQREDL